MGSSGHSAKSGLAAGERGSCGCVSPGQTRRGPRPHGLCVRMRAPRALSRHSHTRLRCRGHRREGLGPAPSKARTLLGRGTKRAHSLVARTLQHLPRCSGRRVQCLGGEGLLEEELAAHSSPLAWRLPRTEEPGGLQPTGSRRGRHD